MGYDGAKAAVVVGSIVVAAFIPRDDRAMQLLLKRSTDMKDKTLLFILETYTMGIERCTLGSGLNRFGRCAIS